MATIRYNGFGNIKSIDLDKKRTEILESKGFIQVEDYWVIKDKDGYYVARNVDYIEINLNCEDEK